MTSYGVNPSFANYLSRLPLFSDAIRRGNRFEIFDAAGKPTGELSPLGPDGYPANDGRWHGVRLFGDPGPSQMPEGTFRIEGAIESRVIKAPNLVSASWRGPGRQPSYVLSGGKAGWHGPSLAALKGLRPTVLRTLDWQMTNKKPDWSKPRVLATDPLQATDRGMAVELQAQAANLLGCYLWWCAPPRFDLASETYEARLEEMLIAIRDNATFKPILEYGNELWNTGFAVHQWLEKQAAPGHTWHEVAGDEIARLKRVADRVFGGSGYYLFVGGQLTVPSHLDKILERLAGQGVTPDLAGPALYVTPLKADKDRWDTPGEASVPTQAQLEASCMARLAEIADKNVTPTSSQEGKCGIELHKRLQAKYGITFFACYEAGQSLIAGHHPWRAGALAAQKSAWMGDLYRGIRRAAEAGGVDLLNWYSAATDQTPGDVRVDVFGLLEGLLPLLPKALGARGD